MKKLNKKEVDAFNLYMLNKYINREDKDNVFGVGLTDKEFRDFVVRIFLCPKWYAVGPIGHDQVNEEIMYAILDKFDKKWRRRK